MAISKVVFLCESCHKQFETITEADQCCGRSIPSMMSAPQLDSLEEQLAYYIKSVAEKGEVPKDADHYIFEAAVEAFYGKNIFHWINTKLT